MNTLLEQFYIYFTLMAIGYIATKLNIISQQNANVLSSFILKISLPFLMITTIPHLPFDKSMLGGILFVFIGTYIGLVVLGLLGIFSSHVCKLADQQQRVNVLHHLFGNVVFIGFPFIYSFFGAEGLLYAAIFQLASDSVLWTFGISYIQNQPQRRFNFRHLFNINTLTFFIALVAWFNRVVIPVNIGKPFTLIAHTTLPLALIYVGYLLSTSSIKTSLKKANLFLLVINKQLIVPIAMLLMIIALQTTIPWVSRTAISALILQMGMPAMTTIAILAREYKSDDKLASENILITTIFSIITLPLLLYFLNLFYS